MLADPGPQIEHYNTPLDSPVVYRWVVNDVSTADALNIIGHAGGSEGRWIRQREDIAGAALTDADVNIAIAGNRFRTLPAATLSSSRVGTLVTTGAVAGDIITITRLDTGAFTYTLANGGAGGGNVLVLPISEAWFADVYFDGTNWIAMRAGQLP